MILTVDGVVTEVRRQYKLFASIVGIAIVLSVIVALTSRPIYRSEVVVAPIEDDSLGGFAALAGQLGGGLGSLAGGLLGGGKNWGRSLAVLRSRHLIEALVTRENLLPVLFPKRDSWLPWKSGQGAGGRAPTMGDAVRLFRNRIMQVREDTKAGLATVRIDWYDPQVAARWANELVALADDEARHNAVRDAEKSLEGLDLEFAKTDGVELRTAIARLIEEQMKSKMVAGVRSQFAYRVIDAAVPSDLDKRVEPTRTTMVIAGTFAGILVGLLVILVRADRRQKKTREAQP